jgi:BASS family bile acid:Na+ symporter
LVAVLLLAIVVVPAALELIESIFTVPLGISPGAIALVVLTTALAPLAVGIAVHRLAPGFAEKLAPSLAWVATVMLLASFLPILITAFPVIASLIGNGTIAALVAFVVVGLAAGHLLGGPDAEDRTVLALSTASRHPAIAMAIAQTNFPEQKLVMAAVLLYLMVNGLVALPYLKWTKRRHAAGPDRQDQGKC